MPPPAPILAPRRRLPVLGLALAASLAAAGCAGTSRPPAVRVISSDPIVEPASGAAVPVALDATEPSPSPRVALEKAVAWATEGLRHYEAGERDAALRSLHDAAIMLVEADLPEVMKEQGLGFLACCLPAEFAHHDLVAILADLEADAESDAELAERRLVEREVRRILARFGDTSPQPRYLEILVSEVLTYIDYYRGHNRAFFERAFARKHKYWPTIESVFTRHGIPVEMGYVALVESGFNPRALSHAGARGLWQFIPTTGHRYGLVDGEDFHDAAASTEAAAQYLLDLIAIFGSRSFLLATAAYNAGEHKVMNCLRGLDDPFERRSFWEIRPCLARETQEYIPRIMAAAVLSSDPQRFGFALESPEQVRARFDVVVVPRVTPLDDLAALAGVGVGELRLANSDLAATARATPGSNFPLYVPAGAGERVAQALAHGSLAARPATTANGTEPRTAASANGAPPATVEHVVRAGETLSEIASLHGLEYRAVAQWNGLASPYRLRVGQRLVLYPGGGGPAALHYTVQSGNTLENIAGMFAVRYRDLKRWNRLSSNRLRAGQTLLVYPPRTFSARSYQVRRGDTVAGIARRFGVPVEAVLTANGLGRRSIIRPGQRLVVYVPA